MIPFLIPAIGAAAGAGLGALLNKKNRGKGALLGGLGGGLLGFGGQGLAGLLGKGAGAAGMAGANLGGNAASQVITGMGAGFKDPLAGQTLAELAAAPPGTHAVSGMKSMIPKLGVRQGEWDFLKGSAFKQMRNMPNILGQDQQELPPMDHQFMPAAPIPVNPMQQGMMMPQGVQMQSSFDPYQRRRAYS